MKTIFVLKGALARTACVLLLGACSIEKAGLPESTWEGQLSAFNVNEHHLHKTVCDPWGGNPPPQFGNGVEASLFYSLYRTDLLLRV